MIKIDSWDDETIYFSDDSIIRCYSNSECSKKLC